MDVIFSGIQPSGDLTLGNYLGALKNFIPFQDKAECFYCIVNQHAITVPQDPKLLHERTRNLAALYIAAGLDPKKATIFVQSEVPEHGLLGWMMICSTRRQTSPHCTQGAANGIWMSVTPGSRC